MAPLALSQEDVEAVQRLRQLYPPHILASLFDGGSSSLLTPARESVSSFSSGSVRSSVSSSPKNYNRNTGASYTSSIPAISERAVSPQSTVAPTFQSPSIGTPSVRPRALSRSVSDYAIRDHALNVRSFPQQVAASSPVYFCVHCGNGFDKRADWETHEWIFHERQSFWPCPQPGCQAFFDSGRAFEAHHQAVHGCGKCDHADRTVQLLPERQAWACGFKGCKEVFLDWSRRCKHVASHYELLAKRQGNFRDSPEWTYSTTIRNLLRQPETKDAFKKFMTRCHGYSKNTWPTLEWQPDKCAELQRCLEYRDFTRGIPDVVHLAYRLGHPGYTSVLPTASRPPSPPSAVLSPPAPSPRSSSLRSRTRSRSVRSVKSISTMSPTSPYISSGGQPFSFNRKGSDSNRVSNASSFASGQSLSATSPPLSPPETRSVSPMRAPSIFPAAEHSRPSTAARRRMVAREPEVRGTSSMALLEFLREGPPTGPSKGEHRARRVPRAVPISTEAYGGPPDSILASPSEEYVNPMPVLERKSSKFAYDFDPPISPVTEEGAEYNAAEGSPVSPIDERLSSVQRDVQLEMAPEPQIEYPSEHLAESSQHAQLEEQYRRSAPPSPPQEAESADIQETVLTLKPRAYFAQHYGKILPPTPGPPPTQLLPLPPPPGLSPPIIVFPDNYPETPTTEAMEVPPSPMPPGFTDIANWPAPPPTVVPRSPSPPQLPEVPFLPQITPAPPSPPQISLLAAELPERPRTAHSRLEVEVVKPEVVRLMPPPKRARSSSRGRPRPLRWVSIGTMIEPPVPSPGVDFGNCLSQPLDLTKPASPPASHSLSVND